MADLSGFDARTIEPSEPIGPIPAGAYLAVITETERKANKSGTGEYLRVCFVVNGGEYNGRKINAFLNLWNANEQAKEIAWRDMAAICLAVGVPEPKDSTDIHNIPLTIDVGVRDQDDQGRIFNDIKGYRKRQSEAAQTPASQTWMQ